MKRYIPQFLFISLTLQPIMIFGMQEAPVVQMNRKCGVCNENFGADESTNLTCGHNENCIHCVRDSVEHAINDREFGRIKCPHQGCNHPLTQQEVYRLIEQRDMREVYERLRIQTDPNGRFCPTPNCNHAYTYNPAQGRRSNYECPACHRHYCNNCLQVHHQNAAPCQRGNNGVDAARGNPNHRACPRCGAVIFREGGCNHIRCGCNHEFCWMCLVDDYRHQHMICLPADLARARAIYGEGGGAPSSAQNMYGLNYIQPVEPRNNNYNQHYHNRPFANYNDDVPFIIVGIIGGIGAAALLSYAAYKIYSYFDSKKVQSKDLQRAFDDLLKEATQKKQQAEAGNERSARDFALFYNTEFWNKSYATLSVTQLAELERLVNRFIQALGKNSCDREYRELVMYITSLYPKEASKQTVDAKKPSHRVKTVKSTHRNQNKKVANP